MRVRHKEVRRLIEHVQLVLVTTNRGIRRFTLDRRRTATAAGAHAGGRTRKLTIRLTVMMAIMMVSLVAGLLEVLVDEKVGPLGAADVAVDIVEEEAVVIGVEALEDALVPGHDVLVLR